MTADGPLIVTLLLPKGMATADWLTELTAFVQALAKQQQEVADGK